MLVLMRHGKAERPELDRSDVDRQLSEQGIRSLRATLPRSLRLMPKGASVRIWSSPADRAAQTAQVVLECCKRAGVEAGSQVELVDALREQDLETTIGLVRSCDADIVVAVGHNPFIEEAVEVLTGSRIDFATGGFAAVSLADASRASEAENGLLAPPGRLLWFVQGPVSQRWRTLVRMERTLAKAVATAQERLDAFVSNSDDVEAIHKLRVSIRTLRSLLAFVSPWQKPMQNKACQANLKHIASETSFLRELDVLAVGAAEMEGASPDLIAFCEGRAREERARVLKALSSKRTAKLLEGLSGEISCIEWRKSVEEEGLGADEVRARFDELVLDLRAKVSSLDIADENAVHDVRKDAKRVRYDAEQFSALLGDDAVSIAEAATVHQDDLGAICDARVNIRLIRSFEERELPDSVAWGFALLRAQNETALYTILRGAR